MSQSKPSLFKQIGTMEPDDIPDAVYRLECDFKSMSHSFSRLSKDHENLLRAIKGVKAQNEKLVEALRFYAGSKNSIFEIVEEGMNWTAYNVIYESDLREGGKMDQPLGQLARETLKELGVEGE